MPPTSGMETREIVEAMVRAINSGRAEAAGQRMHLSGLFVDSLGNRLEGRRALVEGWRAYYRLVPDYRIEIDGMIVDGLEAMLHGRARGTVYRGGLPVEGGAFEVPAAWRATSDGGRALTLWQVFADNGPVRALLGP